ncbi:MAG: hypothetical protein AB2806_12480 [Candidatus Thiodiazotropha sp.]
MEDISLKHFDRAIISDDGSSVRVNCLSDDGTPVSLGISVDSLGHLAEILQQASKNAADIGSISLSRGPDEAIVASGFGVGITENNTNVILSLQSANGMLFHFALPAKLDNEYNYNIQDFAEALNEVVDRLDCRH